MALMVCPDCENQVSDQADQCVHCGRPIARLDNPGAVRTEASFDNDEYVPPERRTDVGRNLIDEAPKGMSTRGFAILAVFVAGGAGVWAGVGGIWGFMVFAWALLVGVFLAYS